MDIFSLLPLDVQTYVYRRWYVEGWCAANWTSLRARHFRSFRFVLADVRTLGEDCSRYVWWWRSLDYYPGFLRMYEKDNLVRFLRISGRVKNGDLFRELSVSNDRRIRKDDRLRTRGSRSVKYDDRFDFCVSRRRTIRRRP